MSRKAFVVQVELDIQAVSCPGVWLCSSGKVSLQIYMLDSCVQTDSYKPLFPIQFNETFVFHKTFYNKHRLKELENELHDEWIYIELVQWQDCHLGYVLASFQTTLDELLYPSTRPGASAGVDLDLLMAAKKAFPGTIAPKMEVSTRTTIEETLCECKNPQAPSTVLVNPKMLVSQRDKNRKRITRRVCHSMAYAKQQNHHQKHEKNMKCNNLARAPFRYRKADDDLILRKPKLALSEYNNEKKAGKRDCFCCNNREDDRKKVQQSMRKCACGSGHSEDTCPLCAKYKGCFVQAEGALSAESKELEFPSTRLRSTLFGRENPCICRSGAYQTRRKPETSDDDDGFDESDCICFSKRPTLAEKLHDKLTKTLSAVPSNCSDYCNDNLLLENECENCRCVPRRSDNIGDMCKDFCQKARTSFISCVPDCTAGCCR